MSVNANVIKEYLRLRTETFLRSLGENDLNIFKTFPVEHLSQKIASLIAIRAGQGELDIFCGYYTDDKRTVAVYISLHPAMPVILLDKAKVKERINNLQRQHLPFDQSQSALIDWPG